jgi:outer membrane protein
MYIRFLLYFLIFLPHLLFAQKVWTLEECIQYANEHNLQIRQASLNTEFSEQDLIQSRGNVIPSFNGSANNNYNFGRNIDPFTNQYTTNQVRSNSFSLFASVTLFNGFQIRNTIKQSQYELEASQYDIQTIRNNVDLNITSGYLQILFNHELVRISENQLALTKEQLDRMRKLVEAGKSSPVLLPDLEAQLASEEVRYLTAQNQLKISYLTLAQLMNLNPEEELLVLKPEVIIVQDTSVYANTVEIYQKALELQPQIKSSEYRRLSAMKSYSIAKGRMSPRLTLNASVSTLYASSSQQLIAYEYTGLRVIGSTSAGDSVFAPSYQSLFEKKPFSNQLNDNYNRFAGLTLTIPILNNFQVRTSIARSKIGIKNADLNLEIEKNNLQRQIVLAHTDAIGAMKRLDASKASVRASEEAFRNAEKRLEVGLINSFDYAQVKNRLAQAQSDLLQARYDYIFRTKILDFYRGIPLGL